MREIMKRLVVICLALSGATVGFLLQLPIGLLVGSFLFVGIGQIAGLRASPMKKKNKQGVQMMIGGLVGLNVNSDLVPFIVDLIIPGLIAVTMHILFALLCTFVLVKFFKLDWVTAFCGSVPAGMSEISIIAIEFEADVQVVMLMQLFRLSLLIMILPLAIQLLL